MKESSIIYYRLIALWIICEAFLGGIIHGFRIPVSGLIVGSAAVVCICLIGYYYPKRGAILKATLIVCIFKMMLSPQAPFPAYIAVIFQGLVGELLLGNRKAKSENRKYFKAACVTFGLVALMESALQRIIVLTIIYGTEGWRALDTFLTSVVGSRDNYSLWLGGAYLGLHVVVGVLVGIWAGRIPGQMAKGKEQRANGKGQMANGEWLITNRKRNRKRAVKTSMLVIWVLLIGLYIQSYYGLGKPLLPSSVPLKLFIRSFIIILAWYFVFAPLLKRVLHNWLKKKQSVLASEIDRVVNILPEMKSLAIQTWKSVNHRKGIVKIWEFSKSMLINTIQPNSQFSILPARLSRSGGNSQFKVVQVNKNIYILSGPIQSGKTTSLLEWSEDRDDVFGILTPIINGKRVFMDAHTRETWDMEADADCADVLKVGRYTFTQAGFDRAIRVVHSHIREIRDENPCNPCWLIIDELGPLELRGEGFASIIEKLRMEYTRQNDLGQGELRVFLVVREGLVDAVKQAIKNGFVVPQD